MKLSPQNSSRNSAAEPPQTDPVILANSDESGKRRRKNNDTPKRKRALSEEVKEAKRMKEELAITGEELKQFNAALISNIQTKMMKIRMGHRLVLQMMARQDELMVDILDAIEEDDSVKVDDLA